MFDDVMCRLELLTGFTYHVRDEAVSLWKRNKGMGFGTLVFEAAIEDDGILRLVVYPQSANNDGSATAALIRRHDLACPNFDPEEAIVRFVLEYFGGVTQLGRVAPF